MSQHRKRPAESDEKEEPPNSQIAENRDFLGEFRKVQAEADEVKNALISKTAHLNSSINSGIFGEIVRELKTMRTEIKENQKRNDKKFEGIQRKMEENEKKTEEKLSEYQNKLLEEITKELKSVRKELIKITPIRHIILGEWKMIEHENFEGSKKLYPQWTLEVFSKNLKYELVDGKLKQTGGGYKELIEGGKEFGEKDLFVEDDQVKTFFTANSFIDRYIQNRKLYVVQNKNRDTWKRVYEKV